MTLKKDQLSIIKQINKKIAKAEGTSPEPVEKRYVFKITAGHIVREDTVSAGSKSEAEEMMFQKYGDLSIELVEIK